MTAAVEAASNGRNAGYWYGTIFVAVAFFGPLIVLFAANLVASSARRSRAEEMLQVTPTTDTRRTWAMCLGIALPLAAVGAVAAGAMALIDSVNTIPPEDLQTAGELAQLPFILAGAGLLGVLGARWLPFTGGALITFVVATLGGPSCSAGSTPASGGCGGRPAPPSRGAAAGAGRTVAACRVPGRALRLRRHRRRLP